jgi:hypothetical protein
MLSNDTKNSKDHFPFSVFAETSESVKETTKVDESC